MATQARTYGAGVEFLVGYPPTRARTYGMGIELLVIPLYYIEGITKFNNYPEEGNIVRLYDRETDEMLREVNTASDGTFRIPIYKEDSGIFYVVAVRTKNGEAKVYDMVLFDVSSI